MDFLQWKSGILSCLLHTSIQFFTYPARANAAEVLIKSVTTAAAVAQAAANQDPSTSPSKDQSRIMVEREVAFVFVQATSFHSARLDERHRVLSV